MILEPGETLAGYRIESVLGVGGMGIVYRATQLSLDRPVALKVLSTTLVGNRSFRERFRREGRIAAALEHPNIVPVFEAGETNGLMFLAMRLIDGGTLAERIARRDLTASDSIAVLGPIASALDEAHAAGLVHRDVKPHNILLSRDSWPFLADFGVTKGADRDGLTRTGDFVGTITYAAPEQIRNEPVTGASDVYALAGVLFTCVTGRPPFTSDGELSLMYANLHAPPPRLTELGPEVPAAIDEVFARGLAKDPGDRYDTAVGLIAALESAVAGLSPAALARTPCLPLPEVARPADDEDSEIEPAPRTALPAFAPLAPVVDRQLTAADRRRTEATLGSTPGGSDGLMPSAAPKPLVSSAAPLVDPDLTSADRRRPGAPAPQVAPRRRLSTTERALLFALGAVLLACAPLLGYLVGKGGGGAAVRADSAALSIAHGTSWKAARPAAAAIGGLALRDPLALTGAHSTKLAAGLLTAARPGPDPAPAALRARWRAPVPATPIALGRLQTLRYAGPLATGGRLWMAMIPTTLGWAAVACESPSPAVALDEACAQRAATLRLLHGATLTVQPSGAAVAGVQKALARLARARSAAAGGLGASSARRRAASAAQLAAAQARAASSVAAVKGGLRDTAGLKALGGALRDGSTALRALARAAQRSHRQLYDRARALVATADRAVAKALRALRAAGYTVKPARAA